MHKEPSKPKFCPFCSLLFRRFLTYFLVIWVLVLVSSLLYYYFFNSMERSFWYVLNTSFFYINIPVFSYAVLATVAERGLFNGIRYSLKQVKAYFFKGSRVQMMDEYSAESSSELTRILKEKYLYTSPKSDSTLPLLLASGITFLLMVIAAFF